MFDHVLIGIRDDASGRDALALGCRLGGPGARITLAHVWTPAAGFVAAATGAPHPAENGRALLERMLLLADRDIALVVCEAPTPARGLHELAEALGTDVLVVGSSAHQRTGGVLLADDTRAALHGAPCALAVAPRGYEGDGARRGLSTIGVGYVDSPTGEDALARANEVAEQLGEDAVVEACAIVAPIPSAWTAPPIAYVQLLEDVAYADAERLRHRLDALGVAGLVHVGDVVRRLRAFSEEVDLLVLGSRGFGPVHRLLVGSTTDRLLADACCPLLVLPRPQTTESGVAEVPATETAATAG